MQEGFDGVQRSATTTTTATAAAAAAAAAASSSSYIVVVALAPSRILAEERNQLLMKRNLCRSFLPRWISR